QGTGEFQIDPDPLPACTFDVSAEDSDPPTGSFDCQMSDEAIAFGIPFSHMDAVVTGFESVSQNEALLSGTATLQLPDGSEMTDVEYFLWVVPGDPDQGEFRIRLTGVFDGEPGDAKVGNANYDQWW